MASVTDRIDTGEGKLYATTTFEDIGDGTTVPREVFVTLGKAGGCSGAYTEALGRLISIILKSGAPMSEVHTQLRGITCHKPYGFGPSAVCSCPDALAQLLERLPDSNKSLAKAEQMPYDGTEGANTISSNGGAILSSRACPDCGGHSIKIAGGCESCFQCGYSKC